MSDPCLSPVQLLSTCIVRTGVDNCTVCVIISDWEENLSWKEELFPLNVKCRLILGNT
jgi:hypothetical protein